MTVVAMQSNPQHPEWVKLDQIASFGSFDTHCNR